MRRVSLKRLHFGAVYCNSFFGTPCKSIHFIQKSALILWPTEQLSTPVLNLFTDCRGALRLSRLMFMVLHEGNML
ncbi:hypothetical protein L596_001504 [Steinernema carpocapsae]|uniref:Uncharacterized protein n=1 Tax=Steinernema carpocapsae TaxID=34508 RepID=A0A4U8ULZ2_STECR|nr:hypothetical protein L596_001504 [Steinernema carpocapsae]